MSYILFTIIIYPIRQVIEFFYVLFSEASKNQGISVIGVSLVFTMLCLPLYIVAEKWQETERKIQTLMKPQIKRIKETFKGDEQYMMLTTYYRQQHYHPLMALRSSFGLLIQIPFFIAAYLFLSHLQQLQGVSFLFIKDMGQPDSLFSIGSFTINFLPILMTAINLISGLIYSRGHEIREKIQIFVSAALFLVLLYNMPSGLVLYWTMNNFFSALKNICYKLPKKILCITAYFSAMGLYLATSFYLIFIHTGNFDNRLLLVTAGLFIPFSPLLIKFAKNFFSFFSITERKTRTSLFLLSSILMCILLGIAIPSFVVRSSPAEFSNIDNYGSPLYFLSNTLLQAIGFCFFWPVCLYFLFNKKIKSIFTLISIVLVTVAVINSFVFSLDYGNMSSSIVFDTDPETPIFMSLLNLAVLLLAVSFVLVLIKLKKIRFFQVSFSIFIFSLALISTFNSLSIQKIYKSLPPAIRLEENEIKPIYSLSKNKKNIVVLFLDRFTSSFFPEIIKETPNLQEVYSGFTYYPNTISYGLHTIVGSPAMLGGYDYRPEQINERKDVPLIDKINEGNSTMPILFNSMGFETTFANPVDAETARGFFDAYPSIKTPNTNGTYRKIWYSRNNSQMMPVKSTLIKRNFIWFSFFKSAPVIARETIYKRNWWSSVKLQDTDVFLDSYTGLAFLNELTDTNSQNNTFTLIHNLLPHNPMYLDAPEYTLPTDSNNFKVSKTSFGGMIDFYPAAASIHLVAKWLQYLKENDLYDNTRIVIASDHGLLINTGVFKDNTTCQVEGCNPLLLYKDFGEKGKLKTDYSFMTQCDVPYLASKNLEENNYGLAIHPYTKKEIDNSGKSGEQHLFLNHNNSLEKHTKYAFSAKKNEWYTVRENIFDPANWKKGH